MSDEVIEKHKPVDTPDFWKTRIKEAIDVGSLRHAVYRVPESMWLEVTDHHKMILAENIDPDSMVLDAGCGYGRASEFIDVNPEVGGGYMGVDISPDFIQFAGQLYPDKDFMVGDLTDLPFKDKTFDYAVCISVMIMVVQNLGWSKWEQIQNELLRVSRNIICLEYGTADTDTESNTYYVIKSSG